MAHTQLLRSIRRLASQYRIAGKNDLPVEAIQERQAVAVATGQRAFSRRQFLVAMAAATAGLALHSKAFGATSLKPRIAIIGGGISGLSCALKLADQGILCTVYEASPRTGGRIFSNNSGYWSDNQVTEWGGELIDTGHSTVQGLATRFGFTLDDLTAAEPVGSEATYYFGNGYYPTYQAVHDFAPLYQAVKKDADAAGYPTNYKANTPEGLKLDQMSVWDWIEHRVQGGHSSKMGQLLEVAYTIEYGANTREQSALNLVYLLSGSDPQFKIFGASDERFHVRGGNQQIPLAIADHLAGRGMPVRTNEHLVAIRQRSDGSYTLTFESGHNLHDEVADLVVLTLPFAVLRKLDYRHAGFDSLKQKSIEQLGCGHNGKLQLQFTRRLWNEHGKWGVGSGLNYSDLGYQNSWDPTRAQPGVSGILNNYTGGRVTDQKRTKLPFALIGNPGVQADASQFLKQINRSFPGLPKFWNGKASSSLPHLSPYFNCSYSFWRVNQYHTIAGYEGVRQGNVFFAGEHTSQDFQGFMEGGAAEGMRAASEILAQL
jgi:monoamine oxidase